MYNRYMNNLVTRPKHLTDLKVGFYYLSLMVDVAS